MMLWTHYEARQRGFAVNETAVRKLEDVALAQYLAHPDFTPTGQDTGFMEKGIGPGTIYLSLAMKTNPSPGDEAAKALVSFADNFVKRQNENGSWTTKVDQPPVIDGHDSLTMLILLAMEAGPAGTNREQIERAVQWLKEAPTRDETQSLALRLAIAGKYHDTEEQGRLSALLRARQQKDGGWNQTNDLPTDAAATGHALYALGSAGVSADDPAICRAREFLASSQQADGSWQMKTRNPNAKGTVVSYFGTAWATLGLLKTLPPPEVATPASGKPP
jgi:hypothetical protein